MASVIDSFREVFGDKLSFFKILILSIPVYYTYTLYISPKGVSKDFFMFAVLTVLLLFGVLIETTHNVISEQDCVLPVLNPFKMTFDVIKGLIAIGPFSYVLYLIAKFFCDLINITPWLDATLESLIWFIVVSFVTSSFLMFCTHERILDVFNVKEIYKNAGDLIIILLVFVLKLVAVNIPIIAVTGYAFYILFGFGNIFNCFCAFALVFNVCVVAQYMGQVHYELFEFNKTKD